MSRYINADKYLAKAQYEAQAMPDNCGFAEYTEWLIGKTPSIDIVRCKECKNRYYCCRGDIPLDDNGFCSQGERMKGAMGYEIEILPTEQRRFDND